MNNIGNRLRNKRHEHGLNQKDVADHVQVTNAAVSKWETNGGESMSAIVALKLADKLQVNPHWLILGEGEPNDRVHVPDITKDARDIARRIDRLPPDMREALRFIVNALQP